LYYYLALCIFKEKLIKIGCFCWYNMYQVSLSTEFVINTSKAVWDTKVGVVVVVGVAEDKGVADRVVAGVGIAGEADKAEAVVAGAYIEV
jgi:hypothetical protein